MKRKGIKKPIIALGVSLALIVFLGVSNVIAAMTGLEAHEKYIYPIVRVSIGAYAGGSGTIVYSRIPAKSKVASTYVLTNYHVIDSAITIEEKWDTDLQKNIKKEKRSIVYVEIFKYRDLSTPIGTLKVEADIVLYNEDEDMALIKLRSEERAVYVATLFKDDPMKFAADGITLISMGKSSCNVMDETVAVGCSLGFPPLPTVGHITRKDFQLDSLPYHMSSAQVIYGNSGGAMFLAETGEFIGIPSEVAIVGWGTAIPHMGLFIPIERIYEWLEKEYYDFVYDSTKDEKECLELREREIEAKKRAKD